MREHLFGNAGDLAAQLREAPRPLVQPPQNDRLPLAAKNLDGGFNRTQVGSAFHRSPTILAYSTALINPYFSDDLQRFKNWVGAVTRAGPRNPQRISRGQQR